MTSGWAASAEKPWSSSGAEATGEFDVQVALEVLLGQDHQTVLEDRGSQRLELFSLRDPPGLDVRGLHAERLQRTEAQARGAQPTAPLAARSAISSSSIPRIFCSTSKLCSPSSGAGERGPLS